MEILERNKFEAYKGISWNTIRIVTRRQKEVRRKLGQSSMKAANRLGHVHSKTHGLFKKSVGVHLQKFMGKERKTEK